MDSIDAAYALKPFQGLVHHEDGEYGRGVEHGFFLEMYAIIKHCRDIPAYFAETILTDDGECHASRAGILLRATVNQRILTHINAAAEDIGRHICNERNGAVNILLDFRTVDGIVGGNMQVVKIRGDFESLGDIAVVLVLGAGDCIGIAQALGLLEGLVRPHAGIEICSFFLKVVHCYIQELHAGSAAEEHGFIFIGNVQDLAPKGTGLIHGLFPLLGAVRNGYQ